MMMLAEFYGRLNPVQKRLPFIPFWESFFNFLLTMCVLSAIINNVKRAAGAVVILAEKQEARDFVLWKNNY